MAFTCFLIVFERASRFFTSFGGLFRQLLIEEFGRSSCGRLHLSGLMLVPLSPDSGDVSSSNLMDLVEHDPQKGDHNGPGVKLINSFLIMTEAKLSYKNDILLPE